MTRDRRFSFVAAVLVAGAVWGTAPRAVAGPADTALPAFSDAKPAVSVYYAFGVIKNNNLETDFVCTNIGVQVFDETGALRNALGANSNGEFLNVAPGATVTVGTSGTVILHEDQTLTLNAAGTAANQLRNGSARIIGTSKNISCSAMLVDKLHTILDPAVSSQPPPTMANVPLTKLP